jgi:hypothetical protein
MGRRQRAASIGRGGRVLTQSLIASEARDLGPAAHRHGRGPSLRSERHGDCSPLCSDSCVRTGRN